MMQKKPLLYMLTFVLVVSMVALLAWITRPPEPDPCDAAQADISAAVLAGEDGDQEALVNRAIIMRGKCEKEE